MEELGSSLNSLSLSQQDSDFDWKHIQDTNAYKNIDDKLSQEDFYKVNKANDVILSLVKLNNKTFGERVQRIVTELLKLEKPTSTGHDARLGELKFEIKASRYWVKNKDFKWQHIMMDHEYDYLLLVGVDFDKLKIYLLPKKNLVDMKTAGVVTQQGNAEGQGCWFERKSVLANLREIACLADLTTFITEST